MVDRLKLYFREMKKKPWVESNCCSLAAKLDISVRFGWLSLSKFRALQNSCQASPSECKTIPILLLLKNRKISHFVSYSKYKNNLLQNKN